MTGLSQQHQVSNSRRVTINADILLLLTDEPSDGDLMKYVGYKIPASWRQFGVQLEIQPGELDAFEGTPQDRFLEVFTTWKRRQSRRPISWSTVIDVLTCIRECRLAEELRSKYCVSL